MSNLSPLCPIPWQLWEPLVVFFGEAGQGGHTVLRTCLPAGSNPGLTAPGNKPVHRDSSFRLLPARRWGNSLPGSFLQGMDRWLVSFWRELAALAGVWGQAGELCCSTVHLCKWLSVSWHLQSAWQLGTQCWHAYMKGSDSKEMETSGSIPGSEASS